MPRKFSNLPESFRSTINVFKRQIEQALRSVLKRKNRKQRDILLNHIHQAIMRLHDLSLEIRYHWIENINENLTNLMKYNKKDKI